MKKNIVYNCPVEAALGMIGGKYKSLILFHLKYGPLRYSELQRTISHATPKMLTQQLRELEKDKLISRTVYPVVPPKTEYSLTDFGKTLIPLLEQLCTWGEKYLWDRKNDQPSDLSCSGVSTRC